MMIKGADDGKVSVRNTKIEGMKEHVVMHVTHPMIMKNRRVVAACLRFVASGTFRETNP
jgi:hypothetical protein